MFKENALTSSFSLVNPFLCPFETVNLFKLVDDCATKEQIYLCQIAIDSFKVLVIAILFLKKHI